MSELLRGNCEESIPAANCKFKPHCAYLSTVHSMPAQYFRMHKHARLEPRSPKAKCVTRVTDSIDFLTYPNRIK